MISFPGAFNFVQPKFVVHDLLNGLDLDSLSHQLLLTSVVSFVKVILVGKVQIYPNFPTVLSFKAEAVDHVALALLI